MLRDNAFKIPLVRNTLVAVAARSHQAATAVTDLLRTQAIGLALPRIEGAAKVLGTATYAYEQPLSNPAYACPVEATIAEGRVVSIDTAAAEALEGVLAVLTHLTRPASRPTTTLRCSPAVRRPVAFRGQFIGAVVAESPRSPVRPPGLVRVEYDGGCPRRAFSAEHAALAAQGDQRLPVRLQRGRGRRRAGVGCELGRPDVHDTHGAPQPDGAARERRGLEVGGSDAVRGTQGVHYTRGVVAATFGLEPEQVQVISPHVGGAFG